MHLVLFHAKKKKRRVECCIHKSTSKVAPGVSPPATFEARDVIAMRGLHYAPYTDENERELRATEGDMVSK